MGTPPPPPKGDRASSSIFGRYPLCPNSWIHQDATQYRGRPQPGVVVLDGDPAQFPKRGLRGIEVDLSPGVVVLDGDPAHFPKRGLSPEIFGPCLLWPNGWMDQYVTWDGGRPQPRRLCVRCGPSPAYPRTGRTPLPNFRPTCIVLDGTQLLAPPKRGAASLPNFRLMSLWPNGWMHRDGTRHGGGPWSRPHCARWGRSSPLKKGQSPPFSAHSYCGQMAACIKMPLGMEVGLSPSLDVLDGDPTPSPKRGGAHNFRPTSIVSKRLHGSRKMPLGTNPTLPPLKGHRPQFSANVRCGQTAGWTKMPLGVEAGLGPGDFVFDGDSCSYPQKKGHTHPAQFLAHVCCGQTAGWIKMPLGTEVNVGPVGPGDVVLDGVAAPPKRGTAPSFRFMYIVAKRLD